MRCLFKHLREILVSSAFTFQSSSYSLEQYSLRRCHGDLVSPCFGFPFLFYRYVSVLGIPGYPPGITNDFMIVVISAWVYICYLLTGITTALTPAFKSSPITVSLFTVVSKPRNGVTRNRLTRFFNFFFQNAISPNY